MKLLKGCLGVIVLLVLAGVLLLGYFGFVPGLSSLFGSDKPRNLGVTYTQADKTSALGKSKIVWAELPSAASPQMSLVRSGARPVTAEFTSAEISSVMNGRPWKYWPYANVQVKLNADGSAEVSGVFLKEKLAGYGAYIGAPKEALDFAAKFLPANPVFYVRMKASLVDNKIAIFEPQSFELGRVPMPVSLFLSFVPKSFIEHAYAASSTDMFAELSKVQNKRQLIINFINDRLTTMTGFYAKSAYVAENKLVFDGTIPEKESTAR